jgi:hypothetical protein
MPNDIALQYQNQSDNTNSDVLVFTRNTIANLNALPPTAWQVIEHVGRNGFHNFTYTVNTQVEVTWDGGSSGILPSDVMEGGIYALNLVETDFQFQQTGVTLPNEIDVANNIQTPGGIGVTLYKDGRALMTQPGVAFGQQAEFGLHPTIYVGLVSNVQESDTLTTAVMSQTFTPIVLENLTSCTFGLFGNLQAGYYFQVIDAAT